MFSLPDFGADVLQELTSALEKDNFQPYLTAVGGSGVGILSPYEVHRQVARESKDPITPPDTPSLGDNTVDVNLADESLSLKAEFESVVHEEFTGWAESRGRWLYV